MIGTNALFFNALWMDSLWYIFSIQRDSKKKRLDISVIFVQGNIFAYKDDRSGEEPYRGQF
ncbi:MAG: hypothetical protein ABFQ95_07465, partial [Pseudomonadota bacterium]